MTKAEFCELHPNVKGTPRFYPKGFDFEILHLAISKSRLLQKYQSLNWLCKNWKKIVDGDFDDFETINILKGLQAEKFGNERTYTQADFDALIDDIVNW